MKKSLLLLGIFLLMGCSKRNKDHHKLTVNLCNYKPNGCKCNLYVEVYRVFGMGALGSDLNSHYLTDSVNFRIYLGTYDEADEMIATKCKGDKIYTTKTKKTSFKSDWDQPKIISKTNFSLKRLKKEHRFE
jgi:hypothetical protein